MSFENLNNNMSIEEFFNQIVPSDTRKNERMWNWPIIEDCHSFENVKNLYDKVFDFYNKKIKYINFSNRNACVITLFLFALHAKLNPDAWDELRTACMNLAHIDNDSWQSIIKNAEARLSRPKLKYIEKSQYYVARVKAEAGIPLTAMNGKFKSHEFALFHIWNHIDVCYGIDWALWAEKNTWLGGNAAGICYADAGKKLLTDLQDEQESNRLNFLLNHSFDRPQHFINLIQDGLQSGSVHCDEVPWNSIIKQYKRIFDPRFSEIYVHLEMTEKLPAGWNRTYWGAVKISINGNDEGNCGYVTYTTDCRAFKIKFDDTNANEIENDAGRILVDLWNPTQSISAICKYGNIEEKHPLLEELDENDEWFFKKETDGKGVWISRHKQIKDSYFPLYIIVPLKKRLKYENKLKCISRLKQDEYYDERIIYECQNRQEFIDLGFQWHQMDDNPSNQVMSAWSNGTKLTHINLGLPTSIDSAIYYSTQNGWKDASQLENDKFYACRFSTDCDENRKGENIAVLPENFKYEMSCNNDLWRATFGKGISADDAWIEDYKGNKSNKISPDSFHATHKDILCFKFLCKVGHFITLRIPSPIPGISWRLLDESKENSDFSVIQNIPIVDIDLVRMYYKSNLSVVGEIDISWNFELTNGATTLAISESSQKVICNDSDVLLLRIPSTSVKKLFAATNHPNAVVNVSVNIKAKEGSEISSETLKIARFDETSDAEFYFYFGLLKGNFYDKLPNENKDIWIKVPCYKGTREWNGRHRPKLVNDTIDEESYHLLLGSQKMLVNKHNAGTHEQITTQIRNYFKSVFEEKQGIIPLPELDFYRSYILKCAENGIPLCNLWLLQEILHDDRIICKLPATTSSKNDEIVNKFLGLQEKIDGVTTRQQKNNMAFDWRLVRLSSVEKYAVVDKRQIKDSIKNLIEDSFSYNESENDYENEGSKKELEPKFYAISHIDGQLRERDFSGLKTIYEPYFKLPWDVIENWKKAICFIVENVILTEDDNIYHQYYENALCYLRQLEIFDINQSSNLLKNIRNWRKKQLDKENNNSTKRLTKRAQKDPVFKNKMERYATFFKNGWKKTSAKQSFQKWESCNDEEIYYDEKLLQSNVSDMEIERNAGYYGMMICLWRHEMLSLLEQEDPSNQIVENHNQWICQIGFYEKLLNDPTNNVFSDVRKESIPKYAKKIFDENFEDAQKNYEEKISYFERKYKIKFSAEDKALIKQRNLEEIATVARLIDNMKNILGFTNSIPAARYMSDDNFTILKDLLIANSQSIINNTWTKPNDPKGKSNLIDTLKSLSSKANENAEIWYLARLQLGDTSVKEDLKHFVETKLTTIKNAENWCLARLQLGDMDAKEDLKQVVKTKLTPRRNDRIYWNNLLENVKDEKGNRLFSNKDIGEIFYDAFTKKRMTIAASDSICREWRLGKY